MPEVYVRPKTVAQPRCGRDRFVHAGQLRDGVVYRWNCTEVYRKAPEGLLIIQSHWSFTQPPQA